MELNIGTNIKRLRLAKGMTQEQLAELLTVSTAAVSKWEAKNTYPDITLLFPLAEIFGVSVDELLGYDEAKAKADIDNILAEYRECGVKGDFKRREELIKQARKKYPHDFRIMNAYMWELAGGSADNDAKTLLENKPELAQICNCILEGCTQDDLRAGAINVKAKLLRAEGKTDEALEMLSRLPSWHAPMVKEQLFGKDTPEYRWWNKRNCYGLMDVLSNKFARIIRFDPELSIAEKLARLENIAQAYAELGEKPDMAFFCIGETMILAETATMLQMNNAGIDDIIRVREKEISAMKKMMRLAENDEVLKDCIAKTYKTDNPVAWLIDFLANTSYSLLAKLREYPQYTSMLEEYGER